LGKYELAVAAPTYVKRDDPPAVTRGPVATARLASQMLVERFGQAPRWIVAAPGRVNLIGEHTDYNDGFVLPMAIERYTAIAASPTVEGPGGATLSVHSAATHGSATLRLGAPQRSEAPPWANYLRGVVAGFQRRGIALPSLSAVIASDVPLGAGLSSSAALEVATATLFELAAGVTLDKVEKARLCQTAEHELAGVPCGLMDPLASILGEARGPLLIDCRTGEARVLSLADTGVSVLVVNSRVRHSLGDGAYAKRRAECEAAAQVLGVASLRDATARSLEEARDRLGSVLYRRAKHVVTENARTLDAARAFEAGDSRAAGALFYESHRSLRDDYEVSCEEIDVLVDAARELGEGAGVYGARITGGGFGGCTVTLVETDKVGAVRRDLCRMYERRTGRTADAFVSRPALGAHAIALPLPAEDA
jgi:galactokinase